jgi:hypothetical protein
LDESDLYVPPHPRIKYGGQALTLSLQDKEGRIAIHPYRREREYKRLFLFFLCVRP